MYTHDVPQKCNNRTRPLWTHTVPDVRLFLAPYADMSNWIKRLAGCQNCQKNGNTMWAGMTGQTERRVLVVLEAEFFHFLDQGRTIQMQQVCRLALDPSCFHKGLHEELFFKPFDQSIEVDAVVWDVDARDASGDTGAEDFIG